MGFSKTRAHGGRGGAAEIAYPPGTTGSTAPAPPPALQNWVRSGVVEKILLALAAHLKDAGGLPHRMFCGRDVRSGQERGRMVGKTKRGQGTKIMGMADGAGLPLALRAESASPAEVKLVEATMEGASWPTCWSG